MEDLALARKTLIVAAEGLEGVWLLLRMVSSSLDPISSDIAELKAPKSLEADAVIAAEEVSEELTSLVKRLRGAAKSTTQSLIDEFEAAKAAMQEEGS